MLANLVWHGCAVVQSDNATEPCVNPQRSGMARLLALRSAAQISTWSKPRASNLPPEQG
jgi:hypothetical protein